MTCANDSADEKEKQRRRLHLGKREAHYLRFLRTKERPENYQLLKIIGKGAFGEVKLVKRKRDEKIFALKCLVKTEMVNIFYPTLLHEADYRNTSSDETNWLMCALSVIS